MIYHQFSVRRYHTFMLLLTGSVCWAIFLWAPSGSILRNSIGDLVVVIFLYSVIRWLRPQADALWAVGITACWAYGVELLQASGWTDRFDHDRAWVELFLGSTFQWMDLFYYSAGLSGAFFAERFLKNR